MNNTNRPNLDNLTQRTPVSTPSSLSRSFATSRGVLPSPTVLPRQGSVPLTPSQPLASPRAKSATNPIRIDSQQSDVQQSIAKLDSVIKQLILGVQNSSLVSQVIAQQKSTELIVALPLATPLTQSYLIKQMEQCGWRIQDLLSAAISANSSESVRVFLENGANPNHSSMYMDSAAGNGRGAVVSTLLDYGGRVDMFGSGGSNPIYWSIANKDRRLYNGLPTEETKREYTNILRMMLERPEYPISCSVIYLGLNAALQYEDIEAALLLFKRARRDLPYYDNTKMYCESLRKIMNELGAFESEQVIRTKLQDKFVANQQAREREAEEYERERVGREQREQQEILIRSMYGEEDDESIPQSLSYESYLNEQAREQQRQIRNTLKAYAEKDVPQATRDQNRTASRISTCSDIVLQEFDQNVKTYMQQNPDWILLGVKTVNGLVWTCYTYQQLALSSMKKGENYKIPTSVGQYQVGAQDFASIFQKNMRFPVLTPTKQLIDGIPVSTLSEWGSSVLYK